MQTHTAKFLPLSITKAADPKYDAQFVLSASSEDRVGDTIAVEAYEGAIGKLKSLIALWQHDTDRPIGAWDNLRIEGKKLVADLRLAGTALARMVKELLDSDVPLGASIGFRGKAEPRANGRGYHFKEIELLETSIVSVPAHPAARRIAKNFNIDLDSLSVGDPANSGPSKAVILKAKAAILTANRTIRSKP
jgi:HK97 family phage prohead protease